MDNDVIFMITVLASLFGLVVFTCIEAMCYISNRKKYRGKGFKKVKIKDSESEAESLKYHLRINNQNKKQNISSKIEL